GPEQWRAWKNILAQLEPAPRLREMLIAERAVGFETFNLPVDHLYQRFGAQFGGFPALFNIGWSIRRYLGQDKAEMIEYLDHMNLYIAQSTQPYEEVHKANQRLVWREPGLASSTFI